MESDYSEITFNIIVEIEDVLSRLFPEYVRGERISLREEIRRWAEQFGAYRDLEVESRERNVPLRRYSIILRGKRKVYVLAIHDPIGRPTPLSAESITGADYAAEFPCSPVQDKFLLVQLKRKNYGMPPKQYFGMGAFYMYTQYLIEKWYWTDRFRSGAEYVTKGKFPHEEFLFVKIIENDVYIPMSSILRTFDSRHYRFNSSLSRQPPASGQATYDESAKYVDFHSTSQHLTEYYVGLSDFMNAAHSCKIGIRHSSGEPNINRKLDSMFFMSNLLFRPNIVFIETSPSILERIRL